MVQLLRLVCLSSGPTSPEAGDMRRPVSCPPVCLLLCSPRWITTGPGGHCFNFAKSISHPVWSWHSQEEVRSEPHSLSPILEFSSFLESLWWNQVSKEAEDFCISSDFAVIADIDYAELHGVVPPTPGVTGKMCTDRGAFFA